MRNQINDIIRNDIFFRIGICIFLWKKMVISHQFLIESTEDNLYE